MKLYQTSAQTGADSHEATWTTSAGAASKEKTAFKKRGFEFIDINEVDVPTTRTDLVAFLNKSGAIVATDEDGKVPQ